MTTPSTRRRKLLGSALTAGLVGTAGCLSKQEPKATHWAAGIRWSASSGKAFWEIGFSPMGGDIFTGPAYASYYFRVNDGELQRSRRPDDPVRAGHGDHIEFVIDFDRPRHGTETVFEYTIPDDDDLVGVLAGFAECLHYRGTDEWVVRPLNVDLETDFLGRQKETLLVRVSRERKDDSRDWFVWGHNESIRDEFRDRAAGENIEFVDPGEEATFSPAAFYRLRMEVADGADRITRVVYPEPDADS